MWNQIDSKEKSNVQRTLALSRFQDLSNKEMYTIQEANTINESKFRNFLFRKIEI